MKRWLLILLMLAGCGGSDPREYGPEVDTFRERPLSLDIAGTFSRASPGYVRDWEGVWIPLDVDEPGFTGARRVKNIFLHSGDPTKWDRFLPSLSSNTPEFVGEKLRIHHAEGQRGSPYVCNFGGPKADSQPPTIFAARAMIQIVSGPAFDSWSPVTRTADDGTPSESNNPAISADLTNPTLFSGTAQLFQARSGLCATWLSRSTVARSYDVWNIQFEDLSGAKNPISQEYVASGDKPGVKWFDTAPATHRGGVMIDGINAAGVPYSAGGILSDGEGVPLLTIQGLQIEPEATNLALHNTLEFVGIAVLDGASENHFGEPPAPLGARSIWTDPRSQRLVYNKTDIATAQDQITSITTDLSVFRAGESIWLHIPALGAIGPVVIAESTPHVLRVLSMLPTTAQGQKVGIQRVPGVGDAIIIGMNGTAGYHFTTVTGLVLPALVGVLPANMQHQSVRIDIANPMPAAGGATGLNNDRPVYWYRPDRLPATIVRGAGATMRIVRDDSIIGAGLGYVNRTRNVLEFKAGNEYALFDLAGAPGERKLLTTASAWARTVSGRLGLLSLSAHAGGATIGTEWARLSHTALNVNGTGSVRVLVPAGSVVRVAVPQVEQGAVASSPIVTQGVPATRAATVINTGSN
mgnify:FL=1